jgi:hypothetical protein
MVYIIKPLVETMEPLMKVRKVAPILGLMGGILPETLKPGFCVGQEKCRPPGLEPQICQKHIPPLDGERSDPFRVQLTGAAGRNAAWLGGRVTLNR